MCHRLFDFRAAATQHGRFQKTDAEEETNQEEEEDDQPIKQERLVQAYNYREGQMWRPLPFEISL